MPQLIPASAFIVVSSTTGNNNILLGASAGGGSSNPTGSSDIYIGNNAGSTSPSGESNTIRIGVQGTGSGQQDNTYMAGIYQATLDLSTATIVLVDNTGKLGTMGSSRRFKENIREMGDSTSNLMKLRPVTFLYKPEYDKGPRSLQYGLIAEEVAEVYPDLVTYDKDGQPNSVKYQLLASMLLNELQKQHRSAEAQTVVVQSQQQEIESLKRQLQQQNASFQDRLSKLESYVATQMNTASDNPPRTSPVANGGSQ